MPVRSIYRRLCSLLAVALVAGLLSPVHGESLTSRLRHLTQRKEVVRSDLRYFKRIQRSATGRLDAAERDLEATESRLRAARVQLTATRRDLEQTRADLQRLERQLADHTKNVQAHVLALYRAGDSSYLNVVLQADSFTEFANRDRFVSAMVNQDEYVLARLENLQDQCQAKRADLEQKESAHAALVQQVGADQRRAQARRVEIQAILDDAETKRAACEALLAQMDAEQKAIQEMVQARSRGGGAMYSGTWSGYFRAPVDHYRLTSPFGWRMHPILHYMKFHQGVDLACPYGTPIHAADKGLVIAAGWRGPVSGNTVIISHGSGITTAYCHMSSIAVSEGELVSRGQQIGNVGSTGRSTGPHVHFGVLRNGEWVNPLGFTR
jgi:murein DD-endopeptidase MepM/ murein hydrolase activator NlpD